MKKGLFNRRIPTLFALLILLTVIGISVALIQSGVFYIGKAAPDPTPVNYQIANVTNDSFSVLYTTSSKYEGVVSITNSQTSNSISLDDRDRKTGVKGEYYSHHITVFDLQPNTEYSFKIISGGKEFEDESYKVTTGSLISSDPPAQNPIFGKAIKPDGTPANDSIIIVNHKSSLVTSGFTFDNGEFIIPTNSLRNLTNDGYSILDGKDVLDIKIIGQNSSSSIESIYELAQNLPTITLQQEYVLVESENNQQDLTPELDIDSPTENFPLTIQTPEDGISLTDVRPLFSGTATPNSIVTIRIDNVMTEQISADIVGRWEFRPLSDFGPGKYQLVASSVDEESNNISANSNFTIFPDGSQVFASELNPTTTPTPTPTSTPIPTPTTSPTLTLPSISPSPTAAPIPTQEETSPTPLPTIPFTPTKVPPIDEPGISNGAYVLTGISIALITIGSILLFLL